MENKIKKGSGFSKLGLILSIVGAAVGLGNIWGFPKAMLTHGGIVFLIPYIIAIITLGLPLMLLELNVGSKWRKGPLIAYKKYWNKGGSFVGGIQCIGEVLIGSYYVWMIGYILLTMFNIWGSDLSPGSMDYNWFNREVIQTVDIKGNAAGGLVNGWLMFLVVGVFVMALIVAIGGVKKGIEKVNKIAVPLLFILIIALLIYALTLKGGKEYGVNPLFNANFKALKDGKMWSDAFGRGLFSLSLACGIIVIYSSKSEENVDNTKQTIIVIVADTIIGIFAAIIMGATLGHMVHLDLMNETKQGVKLLVPGGEFVGSVDGVKTTFKESLPTFKAVAKLGDNVKTTTFVVQDKIGGVFNTRAEGSAVVWSVLPIFFTTIKSIAGAKIVATMFFTCLFLAAFSSFISQVETGVASTEETTPLSRKKSTYITIGLQFITGLFLLVSINHYNDAGKTLIDVFDEIIWTGFALISVFAFLLFFILKPKRTKELTDFNNQYSKLKIGKWFYYLLIVSLIVVTFVIGFSAYDFFNKISKEEGFATVYKDGILTNGYTPGQWVTICILFLIPYLIWPIILIKCYFSREKFMKFIKQSYEFFNFKKKYKKVIDKKNKTIEKTKQ